MRQRAPQALAHRQLVRIGPPRIPESLNVHNDKGPVNRRTRVRHITSRQSRAKNLPIPSSGVIAVQVAMRTDEMNDAHWCKAARSAQGNGGCVEIAGSLRHVTSKTAFAAFFADVKAGYYDMDR